MKVTLARTVTALTSAASRLLGRSFGAVALRPLSRPFYDLKAQALDGTEVDLSRFAGQVTMAVNVASECGFTPQYAALEQLHRELAPRGFSVLGFPSNDFGAQEPGSSGDIQSFCQTGFGVTFPLFEKSKTRAGPAQSPVYARLGESGRLPRWNFYKYIIGRDGQVVAVFPTNVAPDAAAVRKTIEQALGAK